MQLNHNESHCIACNMHVLSGYQTKLTKGHLLCLKQSGSVVKIWDAGKDGLSRWGFWKGSNNMRKHSEVAVEDRFWLDLTIRTWSKIRGHIDSFLFTTRWVVPATQLYPANCCIIAAAPFLQPMLHTTWISFEDTYHTSDIVLGPHINITSCNNVGSIGSFTKA
jgi:hypothetical protein